MIVWRRNQGCTGCSLTGTLRLTVSATTKESLSTAKRVMVFEHKSEKNLHNYCFSYMLYMYICAAQKNMGVA
jgi:hypothetical protein